MIAPTEYQRTTGVTLEKSNQSPNGYTEGAIQSAYAVPTLAFGWAEDNPTWGFLLNPYGCIKTLYDRMKEWAAGEEEPTEDLHEKLNPVQPPVPVETQTSTKEYMILAGFILLAVFVSTRL